MKYNVVHKKLIEKLKKNNNKNKFNFKIQPDEYFRFILKNIA